MKAWLKQALLEIDEAYRSEGLEAAKTVAEKHGYRLAKTENVKGGVHLYLEDVRGGDVKENIILEVYDDGTTYYQVRRVHIAALVPGRWRYSPAAKTTYFYPRWSP